jgi:hypothetical protein
MLSLLWTKLLDIYTKILDEKRYKTALLLLILIFLGSNVITTNKVNELSKEIKNLPVAMNRQDSLLEVRLNININQLYADNSELFEMYITTYKNDLAQVIKYTANSNSDLLRALIEKSTTETINEIRKQRINNRYIRPDSVRFNVTPVSFLPNPFKSLCYASN